MVMKPEFQERFYKERRKVDQNTKSDILLNVGNYEFDETTMRIKTPRNIAKITICGALCLIVTDMMNWIPPTDEQRRNLKAMFCIDVEIL